jgi:hypothetical protein
LANSQSRCQNFSRAKVSLARREVARIAVAVVSAPARICRRDSATRSVSDRPWAVKEAIMSSWAMASNLSGYFVSSEPFHQQVSSPQTPREVSFSRTNHITDLSLPIVKMGNIISKKDGPICQKCRRAYFLARAKYSTKQPDGHFTVNYDGLSKATRVTRSRTCSRCSTAFMPTRFASTACKDATGLIP